MCFVFVVAKNVLYFVNPVPFYPWARADFADEWQGSLAKNQCIYHGWKIVYWVVSIRPLTLCRDSVYNSNKRGFLMIKNILLFFLRDSIRSLGSVFWLWTVRWLCPSLFDEQSLIWRTKLKVHLIAIGSYVTVVFWFRFTNRSRLKKRMTLTRATTFW